MIATAATGAARPLVLDLGSDSVFGTFHDAAGEDDARTAVLICPPWGWEEITSYRARRAWAERLAAAGRPTLRIDLPGTGDSAGAWSDPHRVEAWRAAVTGAAAWLADQPGVTRVVAIGFGLGGLIAAASVGDGAPIDDLVLWAAPENGRSWLREQRAFAALQSTRADGPEPGPSAAPSAPADGLLEIGGFILTDETMESLGGIDLATMDLSRLGRLLLLDRDGMGANRRVAGRLADQGASVTEAAGMGWAPMVFHPERYTAPEAVFARVDAWLDEAPTAGRAAAAAAPPPVADHLLLHRGGVEVRETPFRVDRPSGQLFGLLAEPAGAPAPGLCAVFLNAGAVRRVGPNRLWVEAGRRWSARGVPSLRMDLESIGDPDGDSDRYRDVNNFYTDEFGEHVGAILDELERHGLGPDFVLIGLCAGAYWAFHTAARDRRVVAALILNPRAMIWDTGLLARREARKVERLLTPALWSRVARGEIGLSRALPILRAVATSGVNAARRAPGRLRARSRPADEVDPVESRLDALAEHGTRVVLAFSGDEPVYDELAADGVFDHLDRWPNVFLTSLPGRDHTLRPIVAQQAALELLDAELDRLLAGKTH